MERNEVFIMDFRDVSNFYDEIFIKYMNGFELSNTEIEFFKSYIFLFMWAEQLSSEREKKLKEMLEKYEIL